MVKGRNTSVVSIRLPDTIVNQLKDLAENNRVSFYDFIKQKLIQIAADGDNEILINPEIDVFKKLTEDGSNTKSLSLENKSRPNNPVNTSDRYKVFQQPIEFPEKDNKGNQIPAERWNYVRSHRNDFCPCGSGKKYKKCHGGVK